VQNTTANLDSIAPGQRYRGRFAPSPSGPLHFGSLVAAIASYLQALTHNGEWLLRVEDIDPPRERPGAAGQIVAALDLHGFRWTGQVLYQSASIERFTAIVETLLANGHAYACTCTREQVRKAAARSGPTGPVYPGTCRSRATIPGHGDRTAIRVATAGAKVAFDDRVQGPRECEVETEIGDFIVRRKDGLIAYSLAVVVDDHDQGITEIVRGTDLLAFTPAQIHLQRILGFDEPAYCHVPVIVNDAGQKLSKQTGAAALDNRHAASNLVRGLQMLGQQPPVALATASVGHVWNWARENWRLNRVRRADDLPDNFSEKK